MTRAIRRSTAVLVLALCFTTAAQAVPSPRRSAPEPASLLAAAWSWIVLHALPAPKPAVTEKAGCEIDPNGRMHCTPDAPTQSDAGCDIDPDGVR
ncbi:MAG: hypothetical protein QOF89_432 [Acidobacteriota bacterium]|jgi:hypothetical protein|nr:hypothetical protein [Acidobacteriota bacterium]